MLQSLSIAAQTARYQQQLKISAVHEVKGRLLVLVTSILDSDQVFEGQLPVVELEVNTTANEKKLPVDYYLVNGNERRLFNSYDGFIERYGIVNITPTRFIPLANKFEYRALVAGSENLIAKELKSESTAWSQAAAETADLVFSCLQQAKIISAANTQQDQHLKLKVLRAFELLWQKNSVAKMSCVVDVYQLLAAENVLTPNIHDAVMHLLVDVKNKYNLNSDKILALLRSLQPLTQNIIDKLFANLKFYLMMSDLMQQYNLPCGQFKYLLENVVSNELNEKLYQNLRRYADAAEWLDKENFEYIVQHILHAPEIISALSILHEFHLLKKYGTRTSDNLDVFKVVELQLKPHGLLNASTISELFENKQFMTALDFAAALELVTAHHAYDEAKNQREESVLSLMLESRELVSALCELRTIYLNHTEMDKANFAEDFHCLCDIARASLNIKGSVSAYIVQSVFSQRRLCDYLQAIKQKYDPVPTIHVNGEPPKPGMIPG